MADSDPSPDDIPVRERLRTWIRLYRATRGVENELREYLRIAYDTTLPRFDVMSALARTGHPISMTELSRMLLVSNGNATTVVARLAKEGLVAKIFSPDDRRVVKVQLTQEGLAEFDRQEKGHAAVVEDLFDIFDREELEVMRKLLRRLEDRDSWPPHPSRK